MELHDARVSKYTTRSARRDYSTRRRWGGTFAILGATSLALAACGTASSAHGGSGNSTTLQVVEWTNPPAIQVTNKIDAQFEKKYPDIKVHLQNAPTDTNAWNTLTDAVLASKKVDVLATFAPGPEGFPPSYTGIKTSGDPALAQAGELTNLATQPYVKKLVPGLRSTSFNRNGKIYGIQAATYAESGDLYYKKALLSKYHLSVPTTYSQFIDDCSVLKSHGITPIFVAGGAGTFQDTVWSAIVQQAFFQEYPKDTSLQLDKMINQEFWDGKLTWTSPIFKTAVQKFEKIFSYDEPDASGLAQLNAPGDWAAQTNNYAFFIDGSYDGLTISQANPKLKYGEFQIPTTNDVNANKIFTSYDLTWMVPSWAPQHGAALKWLDFFFSPKIYQEWLNYTQSFPTLNEGKVSDAAGLTWYNTRTAQMTPNLSFPIVPAGAGTYAGGLDFSDIAPFGTQSPEAILAKSAKQYSQARRSH